MSGNEDAELEQDKKQQAWHYDVFVCVRANLLKRREDAFSLYKYNTRLLSSAQILI